MPPRTLRAAPTNGATAACPPAAGNEPHAAGGDQPSRHVDPFGNVTWRLADGTLHRDGGPASEHLRFSNQSWYRFGLLHRRNGPALTHQDGVASWYLWGHRLTEATHRRFVDAAPELWEIADALGPTWAGWPDELFDAAAALAGS